MPYVVKNVNYRISVDRKLSGNALKGLFITARGDAPAEIRHNAHSPEEPDPGRCPRAV